MVRKVAIIGGGLAGTATLIRLAQFVDGEVEILIIEEHEQLIYGGVAYSNTIAKAEHLFNLQASRISIFREHRLDFVDWLVAAAGALEPRVNTRHGFLSHGIEFVSRHTVDHSHFVHPLRQRPR